MKFREIRIVALQYWQDATCRVCLSNGDDITESFECDWQNSHDKAHINIFCSFGIWSSCFSQSLLDERYDEIDISDQNQNEVLYIFYNQVLLIIGEILNDLDHIYRDVTGIKKQKDARAALSGSAKYNMDKVIGFINNIVKHKISVKGDDFHSCNHHLPVRFEDDMKSKKGKATISVKDISNLENKTSILMPSLIYLIELIHQAYLKIDDCFKSEPEAFKKFLDKHGK